MGRLIDADELMGNILAHCKMPDWCYVLIEKEIEAQPIVKAESKWIPFTMRECDEEEKEVYGQEYIMSCELPDDGNEIIVAYKWGKGVYVETDIFMNDVDGCYLESGKELVTEAIAWMPFPEAYKGE